MVDLNKTVSVVVLSQGSHELIPSWPSFYAIMLPSRQWIRSVGCYLSLRKKDLSDVKIFSPSICGE